MPRDRNIIYQNVLKECRKKCSETKTLEEWNSIIFYYETILYPMNPIDYSEDEPSRNCYIRLFNKMNISISQTDRNILYKIRLQTRECLISYLLMCNVGFEISEVTEFPEGHKYEKLYELYLKEDFEVKKMKLQKMVMISQNKWDMSFGLFPDPKMLNEIRKSIDMFLN